ncbi:MAG: hypothetical protein ACI81O_001881 [Cyclobacteriaceae bacterium]|jgi:hypothetical protein
MNEESNSDERRKFQRYDRSDLIINVARPGLAGFLAFNTPSECLNFSLAGLQFGCQQSFQPGEKVILDLCVADIMLKELNGVVVKSREEDDGSWCTGVKLCFNQRRMQRPHITRKLLQIEDKLRCAQAYPYPASDS